MNAIVDALAHVGVRNFEMPVTSDKVWQALNEVGLADGTGGESSFAPGSWPRRASRSCSPPSSPSSGRRRRGAATVRSTADGALVGWVGGACSEPIVVREALRALADGEARLVRIGPADRVAQGAATETVVAASSCASEGVVEVLVEPQLAEPLLAVVGASPAAESLARLAPEAGWRVTRELGSDADAVVVATMGHGDEEALASVLDRGVGYVGLVASARRGRGARVAARARPRRGVARSGAQPGRARSRPVDPGRDRGRRARRAGRLAAQPGDRPGRAGSRSTPSAAWRWPSGPRRRHGACEGQAFYFCAAGCRSRFEAEPARYLSVEMQ